MKTSCVGEWFFFMRSSENEFFRSPGPLGSVFNKNWGFAKGWFPKGCHGFGGRFPGPLKPERGYKKRNAGTKKNRMIRSLLSQGLVRDWRREIKKKGGLFPRFSACFRSFEGSRAISKPAPKPTKLRLKRFPPPPPRTREKRENIQNACQTTLTGHEQVKTEPLKTDHWTGHFCEQFHPCWVFPTFFGKGPDCVADPFGTVPRRCS